MRPEFAFRAKNTAFAQGGRGADLEFHFCHDSREFCTDHTLPSSVCALSQKKLIRILKYFERATLANG